MNSLSGSTRTTFLLIAFFWGCMALFSPSQNALAQDPTTPQYTVEEYSAYQAITGEADPTKKMDLILKFFKTYPKSALTQHVTADFQTMLKNLQDAKKWSQSITVGRQFLTVFPDDNYTIALVATAYAETKDYRNFVILGEEVYKANPNGNLAYSMAKAYQNLGNNAKLAEWAEKTVAKLPENHEMLLELAKIYVDANRTAEADKYAKQCLKVIQAAAKPEQSSEKDWTAYKNYAQMMCYYIIGKIAYDRQSWAQAITNLEQHLKFNARNDMAYYYLGESYWQARNTILALKNYAKASLLGGNAAGPARQKLESMWKASHQGSLAGLDKVIAAAKAELQGK
jgi:tetratricopeptide (TPR) repeat protein